MTSILFTWIAIIDIPRPPGSSNHPGHINQDGPRIPGTGPGNGIHPRKSLCGGWVIHKLLTRSVLNL